MSIQEEHNQTEDKEQNLKLHKYYLFLEMMINMRRNVIYSMFMFQPASKKVEA